MALSVLHLSTYAGNGGAGRAASSLHAAMLEHGIDSRLRTAQGLSFRVAGELDRRLWRLERSPHVTWRSPARFGSLSAREINASDADIVNLHWVTDGFLSVEQIGRITKPLVWTMHDMWPFTGTQHYTADSVKHRVDHATTGTPRWVEGFTKANRPADESGLDLDRLTWDRKRRHWTRPPHLVPVSTWLGGLAAQSALARQWPMTVIPNVMPIDRFAPQDRALARQALGLPRDIPLIAFTASAGIGDRRKGWQHLRAALPRVQAAHPDVAVIVIGPHAQTEDPGTSVPVFWQGEITEDATMARLLAAADVVAVPSETDNLPMTACEAQTAGRAVVAFNVGGLPDIVTHRATGYLARPFDAKDLAQGLVEAIGDSRAGGGWGALARVGAQQKWSGGNVAQRYLDLYRAIVDEQR